MKHETLKKVVAYLTYHADNPPKEIEKPLKSVNMNEVVSQWDADFVSVPQETLFELILVGTFETSIIAVFAYVCNSSKGCQLYGHQVVA